MNLPGLLIEYLINGAIALLWISRLINLDDFSALRNFNTKIIRRNAAKTIETAMFEDKQPFKSSDYKFFWKEKIEIEKSYPELNKELSSRSSRDRIARGTILNLIPISLLYHGVIGYWGIALIVIAIAMWVRFEHYNRCFELRAAYSIRNERK